MRTASLSFIVATAIVAAAASSSAVPQSSSSKKAPKIISLSGCIERDDKTPDQFTITDPKAGGTYRVSGKDFLEFLGRPVQLDGGVVVKGFSIKGGLQPNPNIAAQAGAIDPGRAAVQAASQPTATSPNAETPEFRVKAIHATGGTCR